MFNVIKKVIQYPRLTGKYPKEPVDASLFIGKPEIDQNKCNRCGTCIPRCPSSAIVVDEKSQEMGINLDQCIFCALCEEICPAGAIRMTHEFELAEKNRHCLRKTPAVIEAREVPGDAYEVICSETRRKVIDIFGRSMHIREVDAGSCNGCDYEINALNNPLNDLERLGMHFVASPRHADMLLVTGTATRNMELALVKTYNATPDPKLVVAVGACACSGGIFRDTYATRNGIDCILPVDVYVPGCPPRPQAIIYGILKALNRLS
ncbi:MAG TPA: NADH-quinone oxidoreductase subunit NuoB [Clostridia bacterium]|nr:NADH-quinone oxidoreductase subunit NuoB [Clostridia bacterium]